MPDMVVLEPKKSVVLTIRSAELLPSNSMGFSHTLRFPRVEKIRQDKPVEDCLSTTEFLQIKDQLNQRHKK